MERDTRRDRGPKQFNLNSFGYLMQNRAIKSYCQEYSTECAGMPIPLGWKEEENILFGHTIETMWHTS